MAKALRILDRRYKGKVKLYRVISQTINGSKFDKYDQEEIEAKTVCKGTYDIMIPKLIPNTDIENYLYNQIETTLKPLKLFNFHKNLTVLKIKFEKNKFLI